MHELIGLQSTVIQFSFVEVIVHNDQNWKPAVNNVIQRWLALVMFVCLSI